MIFVLLLNDTHCIASTKRDHVIIFKCTLSLSRPESAQRSFGQIAYAIVRWCLFYGSIICNNFSLIVYVFCFLFSSCLSLHHLSCVCEMCEHLSLLVWSKKFIRIYGNEISKIHTFEESHWESRFHRTAYFSTAWDFLMWDIWWKYTNKWQVVCLHRFIIVPLCTAIVCWTRARTYTQLLFIVLYYSSISTF